METSARDRQILRDILNDFAAIPYTYGDFWKEVVFDDENDRYLLMSLGRDVDGRWVHHCVFHVDLIRGKFWIQHDATDRPIASELEAAGVPRDRIVLGFREPEYREFTGYAVA